MRLASNANRIHAAGGEVIAVSVDDAGRQAGMFARWRTPHILYVSDPGGERLMGPLHVFDSNERGGIGLAAVIVIAADGSEVYRFIGRDYADRTVDSDVFAALEALGLPPIEAPVGGPSGGAPDDLKQFFRSDYLLPYFRGNRYGAHAIAGRLDDPAARRAALEHRDMCDATLEAWDQLNGRV